MCTDEQEKLCGGGTSRVKEIERAVTQLEFLQRCKKCVPQNLALKQLSTECWQPQEAGAQWDSHWCPGAAPGAVPKHTSHT